MITKDQAEAIEAAANAGISCFWSSDGIDYRIMPSDDSTSLAVLDVRDAIAGHVLTFAVFAVWVEGDDLHMTTANGFKIVLLTEDGEDE